MAIPDQDTLFPIAGVKNTVFLRPLMRRIHPTIENITIGDYTYYSDFQDPTQFFDRNVRYNFGFSGAQLAIGKFCALAHGTTFIMADANHVLDGISTYPFPIFGGAWSDALPLSEMPFPNKGSIIVGHDVWFGYQSLVLPGVRIGHGAIVAACAVVTCDVPDYAVVAGNPARIVKQRFDPAVVEQLLALAWWEWPDEVLIQAIPHLIKGDICGLRALAADDPPFRG